MSLPPHTHTKTLYSEEDTGQSPEEPQQSMGRKRESQRGPLRRVEARPNGLRPSGAAWQHSREPRPGFESSLYNLPAMLTWGLHSPICKTGLIYFFTARRIKGRGERADILGWPPAHPQAAPPSRCWAPGPHFPPLLCLPHQTASNPQKLEI